MLFQGVQSSEANRHLMLFLLSSGFTPDLWVLFSEHLPLSESPLFTLCLKQFVKRNHHNEY